MGRYLFPQKNLGIRKGCWTPEEDALLTTCVEKYGEGKWKHVPLRAGLNRCRKSCRLRWLNYLHPNIKRSEFAPDEVDLIIKLHKLLGNRWSLIAGRIPGRTANDIKNYWNSHLSKKLANEFERKKGSCSKVIKPRPFTFPANSRWLMQTSNACGELHQQQHLQKQYQQPQPQAQVLESSFSSQPSELSIGGVTCPEGEERTLLVDNSEGMGSGVDPLGSIEEIEWDDFFLDMDLWNSLGTFEVNQNI